MSPSFACILPPVTRSAPPCLARFAGLVTGLVAAREEDEPDRAGEDRDICHVEGIGVLETAAGHVEKVRNGAVEDAIDHVAKGPADEKPARYHGESSLVLRPDPPDDAARDQQGDGDEQPA